MNTEKIPYELLFRWDEDGNLAGAHVGWRYVTKDNGRKIGETTSVEPVSLDTGFPLTSVVGDLAASIATKLAATEAKLAEREAELSALQSKHADIGNRLVQAEATLKTMAKTPPDVGLDGLDAMVGPIGLGNKGG